VSEFFFRLTPDHVLGAVEAGGFLPTGHCSALNSLENRVYDVRLDDGSHVVAKFYRPERWTREAILEEHRFLADLREAEIPVCAPLEFPDGGTLHEVEEIFYAVWPRTGGRAPDELTDESLAVLGRLLARIHNAGAGREAPERRRLSSEHLIHEPLRVLEPRLPSSCAARYRQAALQVAELYDSRAAGVPVHRIHGDCHVGNLLRGDAGFFFLDFDDFVVGPAVQDIWMLAPGRDAEGLRQRDVVIQGYREFRDFSPGWLSLAEPLRAMRFVYYAAWIARRWEDPAFPPTFPHFGSEAYWDRETRDLEEQLERIESGAADPGSDSERGSAPSGDDDELTNEDFFWDL
jgi:Ser/Thr protein kinase RdoA (MazF antagonist)